jgi:hypothetical protein
MSLVFILFLSLLALTSSYPTGNVEVDSYFDTTMSGYFELFAHNQLTLNHPNSSRCDGLARRYVRATFHDFATFNITDGSGGLDGSIQYELDRPENRK